MAVPASGVLSLRSIATEIATDSYGSHPTDGTGLSQLGQVSLKDMSTGGGANSAGSLLNSGTTFDAINRNNLNANKPDGSTPHAMSEFYKYDHNGTISASPSSFSQAAASAQNSYGTITISHADYSTWSVTSKPSWVSVNTQSGTGAGSIVISFSANSGGARQGSIVITYTLGTAFGSHPLGTNTTTTRSVTVSQAAGGDNDGGNEGLDGEDP